MNRIDALIIAFDKGLRTVFAPSPTARPLPGGDLPEAEMSSDEKRHAGRLMRIDHTGEVCAQALYQGQALTARDDAAKEALTHAAWEEVEHLNWTERRIEELGGRKSFLNPAWYVSSLAIGVTAGLIGDKWNLGFLAETEKQVVRHLESHLQTLPPQDVRSRAIVTQMRDDEAKHATMAIHHGAAELPFPIKAAMRGMAKAMTGSVYWI